MRDGVELITEVRSNMKAKDRDALDLILLRKRAIIESVNNELEKHLSVAAYKAPLCQRVFVQYHECAGGLLLLPQKAFA